MPLKISVWLGVDMIMDWLVRFLIHNHYRMPSASRVWEKERAALIAAAQKRCLPLNLGGDGHSAKFGSYSIIDLEQNIVIDLQLVQVRTYIYK